MPPTASRNGTAKTVLLRRAIWRAIHAASATTAPMPPDAMFHRSAAKAIRATPCRNRHGVAFVSKAAPFIPPVPPRRRYGFGAASMLFRQRPRAPPAAARTRQHKQADKRRRAISLRLPYRFGGGQGYIPTPRRRSSSVKSRTGIDLPILHGNAAVPKAAVRPSPADPAERRHKKRPDKHAYPVLSEKHACPEDCLPLYHIADQAIRVIFTFQCWCG